MPAVTLLILREGRPYIRSDHVSVPATPRCGETIEVAGDATAMVTGVCLSVDGPTSVTVFVAGDRHTAPDQFAAALMTLGYDVQRIGEPPQEPPRQCWPVLLTAQDAELLYAVLAHVDAETPSAYAQRLTYLREQIQPVMLQEPSPHWVRYALDGCITVRAR